MSALRGFFGAPAPPPVPPRVPQPAQPPVAQSAVRTPDVSVAAGIARRYGDTAHADALDRANQSVRESGEALDALARQRSATLAQLYSASETANATIAAKDGELAACREAIRSLLETLQAVVDELAACTSDARGASRVDVASIVRALNDERADAASVRLRRDALAEWLRTRPPGARRVDLGADDLQRVAAATLSVVKSPESGYRYRMTIKGESYDDADVTALIAAAVYVQSGARVSA